MYVLDGDLVAKALLAAPPLAMELLDVTPSHVTFSMNTIIGEDYTIWGRTNLTDLGTMVDQFTAVANPTVRMVNLPMLTQQFFQGRKEAP